MSGGVRLRSSLMGSLRIVIGVQGVVIIALMVFTAFDQPFYARIDERADVSYVEYLSDHARLPVLGKTCVQNNLVALQPGYPGHSPGESCDGNLNAASYESFQPPLYYAVGSLVFKVPLSIRGKVRALRLLSVLLTLITIVILIRFVRREFGDRSQPIIALTLCFFLVPGVVLRASTVSNGPMEILIATCFFVCAWSAVRSPTPRRILLTGLVLGLALLTKTTLTYLILIEGLVIAACLYRRRDGPVVLASVAAGVIALGLIAPWVAFNERHYHAVTADAAAQRLQRPSQNPHHYHYHLGDVPIRVLMLADILPQEWEVPHIVQNHGTPVNATPPRRLLAGTLWAAILVTLGLALWRGSVPRRYWWFALPVVLTIGELTWLLLAEQWDVFVVRYTYPTLIPFAVLVSLAASTLLRSPRRVAAVAAAISILLVVVFGYESRHGLGAKCCLVRSSASASTDPSALPRRRPELGRSQQGPKDLGAASGPSTSR
jgi:4-amino-4-deoxy-L-arabinose transferase-like glycosyltransferase